MNRVFLVGRLGADVEIRYTADSKAVATLRVATDESYRDNKTGKKVEKTEWHRVIVWGTNAENCAKYLSKGRLVHVEGKNQTRSWEDKDTKQKRYTTEVVASKVTFLDRGKDKDEPAGVQDASSEASAESEVPL